MKGLYQVDPYLLQYHSIIKGSLEEEGRTGIIFEDTIFYPESGGQPSDQGTLVCDVRRTSHEVLHVEERPEGIVHWIAGEVKPIIGASVLMTVDGERRRDHMQQHHGQHIISAIFERDYGWDTVGFHLGEEASSIDLNVEGIFAHVLEKVETEANRVVMENLSVSTREYKREELNPELLKKLPPGEEVVRLVMIPGLDENACCGTHPRFTGEVGPIKLLKTEKSRNNMRIHFICGDRTVQWMQQTASALQKIESAMGASGDEAISRYEKREAELKKLQKERKELLPLKYRVLAQELEREVQIKGSIDLIIKHLPEADMETLRGIANEVCSKSGRLAVLVGGEGTYDVLIARSSGVTVAANKLSTELWPILKGKGGGSPDLVQGKAQELPMEQVRETVEKLVPDL